MWLKQQPPLLVLAVPPGRSAVLRQLNPQDKRLDASLRISESLLAVRFEGGEFLKHLGTVKVQSGLRGETSHD